MTIRSQDFQKKGGGGLVFFGGKVDHKPKGGGSHLGWTTGKIDLNTSIIIIII